MTKIQTVKAAVTTKVSWGPTSTAAALAALAAAGGTIWAGIQGRDTATVTGGAITALTVLAGLGGRFAQAIVGLRHAATVARPWVDAGLDALTDPEVDDVPDTALPTDGEEFEVGPEAAEIAVETPPGPKVAPGDDGPREHERF